MATVCHLANLALRLASVISPTSVEKPVVQDAIEKADLLIEAMGWIRQFRDKITVIKLGGSAVEDPEALRATLQDVVFMATVGLRPVLGCDTNSLIPDGEAYHLLRGIASHSETDRPPGWRKLDGVVDKIGD